MSWMLKTNKLEFRSNLKTYGFKVVTPCYEAVILGSQKPGINAFPFHFLRLKCFESTLAIEYDVLWSKYIEKIYIYNRNKNKKITEAKVWKRAAARRRTWGKAYDESAKTKTAINSPQHICKYICMYACRHVKM